MSETTANEQLEKWWESPALHAFPDTHSDLKAWCEDACIAGRNQALEQAVQAVKKNPWYGTWDDLENRIIEDILKLKGASMAGAFDRSEIDMIIAALAVAKSA